MIAPVSRIDLAQAGPEPGSEPGSEPGRLFVMVRGSIVALLNAIKTS
jgi:hypothetical protein